MFKAPIDSDSDDEDQGQHRLQYLESLCCFAVALPAVHTLQTLLAGLAGFPTAPHTEPSQSQVGSRTFWATAVEDRDAHVDKARSSRNHATHCSCHRVVSNKLHKLMLRNVLLTLNLACRPSLRHSSSTPVSCSMLRIEPTSCSMQAAPLLARGPSSRPTQHLLAPCNGSLASGPAVTATAMAGEEARAPAPQQQAP